MKTRKVAFLFLSFFMLVWQLLIPSLKVQGGTPAMELKVSQTIITVGNSFVVEINAKDIPNVYGADVELAFDPSVLAVVDMDTEKEGIQFQKGDFLNSSTSYELQNSVNEDGTIDYALTLLRPAVEVSGSGTIAMITFTPLKAAKTTLSIAEAQFGTVDGERVTPSLDSQQITILDPLIPVSGGFFTNLQQNGAGSKSVIAIEAAAVVLLSAAILFGTRKSWSKNRENSSRK